MISPVHPGVLRQKRKRAYFHLEEDPGRLHQGYNGLGGHSTVLMPAQSILRPKKKVAKPVKISKFVCNTKATNPPLPQLSP